MMTILLPKVSFHWHPNDDYFLRFVHEALLTIDQQVLKPFIIFTGSKALVVGKGILAWNLWDYTPLTCPTACHDVFCDFGLEFHFRKRHVSEDLCIRLDILCSSKYRLFTRMRGPWFWVFHSTFCSFFFIRGSWEGSYLCQKHSSVLNLRRNPLFLQQS
jgi:hypothetical protein